MYMFINKYFFSRTRTLQSNLMFSRYPSIAVPANRLRGHLYYRLGHEGSRNETPNL